MLNQVVLVGRLSHDLEIKEIEENKKELSVVIAERVTFLSSKSSN